MKMANPRRCSCDAKDGTLKTAGNSSRKRCRFEAVSAAEVVPVSNIVKAWIFQKMSLFFQHFCLKKYQQPTADFC